MPFHLSPIGAGAQFFDNNGIPLAGGKLYTYEAGTTTPQSTYTDSTGGTALANPIVLDSAGRVPNGGEIWITDANALKIMLTNSVETTLATWDGLWGIGAPNGTGVQTPTVYSSTGDGTTVAFNLPSAPTDENTTMVFVNGAYIQKSAYSVVGAILTFDTAPTNTHPIEVVYS